MGGTPNQINPRGEKRREVPIAALEKRDYEERDYEEEDWSIRTATVRLRGMGLRTRYVVI